MASKQNMINTIEETLFGKVLIEKDHYQRDRKYLIRCAIVSTILLTIILSLLVYINIYSVHDLFHPEIENKALVDDDYFYYNPPNIDPTKPSFKPNHDFGAMPMYHTANDINNDLFCSLSTDQYGNIMDQSYFNLLTTILQLQYPSDCSLNDNHKYLIINHQCSVGLLSSIECLVYYLLMSIFMDRTLILTGSWAFGTDKACTRNGKINYENSMDCFFIPITNCSAESVLYHEYKDNPDNPSIFLLTMDNIKQREIELNIIINEEWFHSDPGNINSKSAFKERILLMPSKNESGFGWRRIHKHAIKKSVDKWLLRYFGLNHVDYIYLAKVFFLRMNQKMKKTVYREVNETLNELAFSPDSNITWFNGDDSLSVMINWGWDCKHKIVKNYWKCFEYTEYMDAVKELKIIQPNLKYVIIISESWQIVSDILEEYDEWMSSMGIKLIGKVGDVLHGDRPRYAVQEILIAMQLQFVS